MVGHRIEGVGAEGEQDRDHDGLHGESSERAQRAVCPAVFIRNFEEIAVPLIVRTAREALEHPHVQGVLDRVLHYPTVPARWRSLDLSRKANPLPALPTEFAVGDRRPEVFSMMTTFGTPLDVTTDELRVEAFSPADAASEALLRALAARDWR